MAEIASFSGLSSGVQWADLVDQIIAVESHPITRLEERITLAQQRTTAWSQFQTLVTSLRDAADGLRTGTALRAMTASLGSVPAGTTHPLASATTSSGAAAGNYAVRVLAVAAHEKLGGDIFASRTEALGLSGEMLVNGKRVEVLATDSLDLIAKRFNDANTGATASGVGASVLSTGAGQFRLVLTSAQSGAAGIDLIDGSAGIARSLGFLDDSASIKHATTSGARSDDFADGTTAVSTLLGLSAPPVAGDVTLGGLVVNVDLTSMGLTDIANAINTASGGGGISASVVSESVDGVDVQRLRINGTTSFTDANGIFESLGILTAGRAAVAQTAQSDVMTAGDAVTPATTGTLLTNLWSGGQAGGASAGDTVTFNGTRADGTAFTIEHTISGSDTVQTLIDRLNSAVDGFKAGTATATASLSADGRITVSDDAGGASRLALSIVTHNENGGRLDFGDFETTEFGRAREITQGADAEVEIDGAYIRRASNTISDVVSGLSLQLASAQPDTTVNVGVSADTESAVMAVQTVVDAYNALTEYVSLQLTPPEPGSAAQPLHANSVLRSMRTRLRSAMETRITVGAAGFERMGDLGITIQRDGLYQLDAAKLKAAVAAGSEAVFRVFGRYGSADVANLSFIAGGDATTPGTYAVEITQAATFAEILGSGFGGTYVDDATADTLSVVNAATGKAYSVQLANGMTLAQIVDGLNAQFATAQAHQVVADNPLHSDSGGTAASESTTWADLFQAGVNAGVATGDKITVSGTKSNGTAFFQEYEILDASTQTIGEFRQFVQDTVGTDVEVELVDGAFTVTASKIGSSQFTLAVSSDNAGGGTLSMGALSVTTEGRATAQIEASDVGGQLHIAHAVYGSTEGFEIALTVGGSDGTGALGLTAGAYNGLDVTGTIGGLPATGVGRNLTGGADTAIEGLVIRHTGNDTGAVGSVTFDRGVAASLVRDAERMLGSGEGSIGAITNRIDETITRLNARIDRVEDRLTMRREQLIRQFTAMEQAMSLAQAQSAWLETQLRQFDAQRNSG